MPAYLLPAQVDHLRGCLCVAFLLLVDERLQLVFEVIELVKHKVGMLWLYPQGGDVELPKRADAQAQDGCGF